MSKAIPLGLTVLFLFLVVGGPIYFYLSERLDPPIRTEIVQADISAVQKILGFKPAAFIEVEALNRGPGNDYWNCMCAVLVEDFQKHKTWTVTSLPPGFNFWGKRTLFMYTDDIRKKTIDDSDVYVAVIPASSAYYLLVLTGEWNKILALGTD